MNKIWLTTLLLTGAYAANAQEITPPPAPAPGKPELLASGQQKLPRPPKHGQRPGDDKGPQAEEALKLTTVKGIVAGSIANDRFEYNGLSVKTNSGTIAVMFPPHLGEQIFARAKNGTAVTITGFERTNPESKKEFRLVSLDANGSTIADAPPLSPHVPTAQQQKNITATVKELNYSPNKDVNGFTLSSGERIGIPPHIARQLNSQLKAGEKVTVNGFLEPKRPGVVYSQSITMIRAQTLTIKGQAYLVR
ncbi:hypothetical protein E2R65_03440 [Mucilaginibacter phyllosphaerae]|uniref:Uncharacterized protein n=2 Tax=Mucilaginibacter phyllosphaerae TaxID=1812349 RepID=A0A4Y8AKU5_9SPHI|nr:hypothetical protein [Mucilaginibacter phyllosphaerae]MBB3967715.1 hypothetical protein [Mucilaginibacter phyllosphaerae]TEW69232.1 hypothetical protein E2R65_03440 [Mucilaginibacter phyllosphaerae]